MRSAWTNMLLVGAGGFAGSAARYGLSLAFRGVSIAIPYGTLAANLVGCFAVGALSQFAAAAGFLRPEIRLLTMTGFCGGFTTMSSFVYEAGDMLREGEAAAAAAYTAGTIAGSFAAFLAGGGMVRWVGREAGATWN